MAPCRSLSDYRSFANPHWPLRTPLSAPSRSKTPLLRLALLGTAFGLAILSCRDVTSPGANARYARGIAWRTEFPAPYRDAGTAATSIVNFSKVRVVLHHSDGTVALDTTVDFAPGTDSLPLTLDVKLLPSAPASGEPLSLNLAYINAAGDTVFKGGPVTVTAVPTSASTVAPTPVTIPVAYTGPGATAVSVQITPRIGTASSGNTYTYTAVGYDANNNALPGTPVFWSSLDTTAATVANPAVGTVLAVGSVRTTARIVAQLISGQTDQVTMNVQPPATSIFLQSGSGQTGTVGTALSAPLVVMTSGADEGPVGGVTVTFAVQTGGGSVASTTVVTNSAGIAQTTWTMGSTAGAQTVTATAGTLSGSPLTFTATATAPAHLVVTTSPAAAQVAGVAVTPGFVVSAYDATNNPVPSFTGTVTLAIGTNPGSSTLSGTTSVSAVGGVATFNAFSLNKVGTGYTVVASTAGYLSGTSAAFNIAAGAAANIAISGGNNQTGPANTVLAQPLSATVTDVGGNPVAGVTVHFAVATGGGSVGTAAPVTNASGIATTTWTVGPAGAQSVGAAALNSLGQPLAGSPLVYTANGSGTLASTTVTPHLDTLTAIGATFTLAAQGKDGSGNNVAGTFGWVSRTPAAVTVNATNGVVTGVTNGSSWVVATELGGTKDSALIVVQQRLATINVTPSTTSIYLGASTPAFTASAVDGLGVALSAQPSFTWTTASSAIASITSGGIATGVGLGSTLVQATAGAVTGVATLNVVTRIKFIFVARDSASFSQTKSDTFTIAALGRSRSYKAFAYDSTLAVLPGITFTFLSSNGSVAAIDSTGTVTVRATAAANGTTAISASAQGVSGAAVMNVQQVLTSISLSPATAAIAASGSQPLTARGLDANGHFINSVIAFTYASSAPSIATVNTSGVVTGVIPGSTNITASSAGITSNIAVITVQSVGVTPVISFGRDTVTVGRSGTASIPIYLSKPAASPLTIKLAVKDTFAFFNPTTLVIPAGSTSGNATLNGHNAGTTVVTATDSSGLGYVPDTSVLAVQATVHLTTNYSLVVTDQVSTQVLLSDPSPAGGTYVTFSYGTPGRALVSPDPAFIPAGQLAANIVIQATAAGGTTITPAATGVNGTTSTVTTVAATLAISPSTLRLGAGQFDQSDNVQDPSGVALNRPLSVTLTSADSSTVSVPSPIVIPSGLYYQYFNTTALIPGLVTVTASSAGWASGTMSVRVTTPKLGVSGGTTLNTTSPASGVTVYAEDSTSGVHYRTSSLAVTLSSSDPTVLTVSSPTTTIPAGSYFSNSATVSPVGGGTAWLKATASGHIADSTLYTVVGPKLQFSWSSNLIGVGQMDQNENVQGPNNVTSPLTVTISNPDSSIVGLPPSVVIPTGIYYTYFNIRGKAAGKESFIASAPGYQPDTATYTVTTPRLVLSGGTTLQNFGPAQGFTVYPADSTRVNHYTINPLIVTYTSTDPTVFTVNSTDTVQAGASFANHGTVLPTGAGTAKLIASAPGYLPDTVTYVVQTPKIVFSFSHNVIGKRQYDVNPANTQVPSNVTAPLTATITQKHPSVDSLSATTIVIPSGIYYSYFNYAGLNLGTDTLIVTAPGYLPDTAVLTVSSSRLYTGGGLPGTALTTTTPSTVTVYAADTLNSIHYSLDTIAINAVSSNTAVIQPTAPLIHLLKGVQYVQPVVAYTGPGSASVTYSDSAGVYAPVTTNTVAVTGPSLAISNGTTILGLRQNGGATSANVQVQNNVTGSPLVITLTSSDPTVITVPATVTIPVGIYYVYFPITAHDVIGTIQITATAAGYGSATSNVQVEQPQFLISTAASLNTTSARQPINVYAEDSHGNGHFTNEDVAVTLASSSAVVGTIDSSVVVIAAGTIVNSNARFIPGQAGTTQLSATDSRPVSYRYTTGTQNVAVNTPSLSLWNTMSLGIGQYSDQTVETPDVQTVPLTVSFAHFNSASTTPSSVIIPANLYYNTAVRVRGISAGTDTVTASATGENPAKGAVVVAQGRVDQNSNWPSTLSLTSNDSVQVTIYARDQSGGAHFLTAPTTFTLAASAYIGFSNANAPITSITIPADQQSVSFWIKGTSSSSLPATVTVSNANYATYTSSITVNP